jgi:hypothetical protein
MYPFRVLLPHLSAIEQAHQSQEWAVDQFQPFNPQRIESIQTTTVTTLSSGEESSSSPHSTNFKPSPRSQIHSNPGSYHNSNQPDRKSHHSYNNPHFGQLVCVVSGNDVPRDSFQRSLPPLQQTSSSPRSDSTHSVADFFQLTSSLPPDLRMLLAQGNCAEAHFVCTKLKTTTVHSTTSGAITTTTTTTTTLRSDGSFYHTPSHQSQKVPQHKIGSLHHSAQFAFVGDDEKDDYYDFEQNVDQRKLFTANKTDPPNKVNNNNPMVFDIHQCPEVNTTDNTSLLLSVSKTPVDFTLNANNTLNYLNLPSQFDTNQISFDPQVQVLENPSQLQPPPKLSVISEKSLPELGLNNQNNLPSSDLASPNLALSTIAKNQSIGTDASNSHLHHPIGIPSTVNESTILKREPVAVCSSASSSNSSCDSLAISGFNLKIGNKHASSLPLELPPLPTNPLEYAHTTSDKDINLDSFPIEDPISLSNNSNTSASVSEQLLPTSAQQFYHNPFIQPGGYLHQELVQQAHSLNWNPIHGKAFDRVSTKSLPFTPSQTKPNIDIIGVDSHLVSSSTLQSSPILPQFDPNKIASPKKTPQSHYRLLPVQALSSQQLPTPKPYEKLTLQSTKTDLLGPIVVVPPKPSQELDTITLDEPIDAIIHNASTDLLHISNHSLPSHPYTHFFSHFLPQGPNEAGISAPLTDPSPKKPTPIISRVTNADEFEQDSHPLIAPFVPHREPIVAVAAFPYDFDDEVENHPQGFTSHFSQPVQSGQDKIPTYSVLEPQLISYQPDFLPPLPPFNSTDALGHLDPPILPNTLSFDDLSKPNRLNEPPSVVSSSSSTLRTENYDYFPPEIDHTHVDLPQISLILANQIGYIASNILPATLMNGALSSLQIDIDNAIRLSSVCIGDTQSKGFLPSDQGADNIVPTTVSTILTAASKPPLINNGELKELGIRPNKPLPQPRKAGRFDIISLPPSSSVDDAKSPRDLLSPISHQETPPSNSGSNLPNTKLSLRLSTQKQLGDKWDRSLEFPRQLHSQKQEPLSTQSIQTPFLPIFEHQLDEIHQGPDLHLESQPEPVGLEEPSPVQKLDDIYVEIRNPSEEQSQESQISTRGHDDALKYREFFQWSEALAQSNPYIQRIISQHKHDQDTSISSQRFLPGSIIHPGVNPISSLLPESLDYASPTTVPELEKLVCVESTILQTPKQQSQQRTIKPYVIVTPSRFLVVQDLDSESDSD